MNSEEVGQGGLPPAYINARWIWVVAVVKGQEGQKAEDHHAGGHRQEQAQPLPGDSPFHKDAHSDKHHPEGQIGGVVPGVDGPKSTHSHGRGDARRRQP